MLQRSREDVGRPLVRAVADEHMFGAHVVVGRQSSAQRASLWVRIETQRISRLAANSLQHAWGRTKWTFIGVELDQLHHVGLFAWYIGLQVMRQAAPETAHCSVQIS